MKRQTEDGYIRTNREMSQEPRGTSGFCFGCDCNKVPSGQKCEICGHRCEGFRSKAGKPLIRD